MPRIPHESLPNGGKLQQIKKNIESNLYKYAIFVVLFIELLTYFLADSKQYLVYYYPMLSSLCLGLLVYGFALKGKILKFCTRKIWAFKFLTYYYFFGFLSVLFQLSDKVYTEYISYGLLIIAIFIAASTLYNNEQRNKN